MLTPYKHSEKPIQFFKISPLQKQDSKTFVIQKTIEESIVMSLINLADGITKRADAHCQKHGITTLQYLTLLHLAGDPNIDSVEQNRSNNPIVASELAERLNVSRPNITNLLNLLIEKNLVTQIKDRKDWRRKPLVLTEEGWDLIEKMAPYRRKTNRILLAHLDEEKKACFLEVLRTCHDLLKVDCENG